MWRVTNKHVPNNNHTGKSLNLPVTCDKKIYSHTQKQRISDDRSDLRSELPREQNKTFGPKKSMEPRTAAILGSENTLNFALNFKSGKNNFQNPPICWPIHPLLEVL